MLERHLELLACPRCHGDLQIKEAAARTGERIETGTLACGRCPETYPVVGSVPRFVPAENYAGNFGHQWTHFSATQFDSHLGLDLARKRFERTTGWPSRLEGERILEAGCGAGRFTEIALATGATVLAFDFAAGSAECNQRMNGASSRLLVAQADVFHPPVRPGEFDRAFCMGVLQHTPAPEEAFRALVETVRPGGAVAIDVYLKKGPAAWLGSYRRARWLTRHLPVEVVHALVDRYVDLLFPLAKRLWRSGGAGRKVARYGLLLKDRSRKGLAVDEATQKEWLSLILLDQLSAWHDKPQSIAEVGRWLERAGLEQAEAFHGGNGVIGRGRRPAG